MENWNFPTTAEKHREKDRRIFGPVTEPARPPPSIRKRASGAKAIFVKLDESMYTVFSRIESLLFHLFLSRRSR